LLSFQQGKDMATPITSFFELFASIFIIVLGTYILRTNPKDLTSRFFSLMTISMGLGLLFEYCIRISPSSEVASIFHRMALISYAFGFPLFAFFGISYSGKSHWIKSWLTKAIIFLPSIIFSFTFILKPSFFVIGYELRHFGWWQVESIFYIIFYYGQMLLYVYGSTFFILISGLRSKKVVERRQSAIVFLASLLPLAAIAENRLFPFATSYFRQYLLPLTFASGLLLCFILIYFFGMRRYSLFAITPSETIDSILETVSSSIIALDPQLKISFVNQSATQLMESTMRSLKEKSAADIFGPADTALIQKLLTEDRLITNFETKINTASGAKSVRINGRALRDHLGTRIGMVVDLEDISERKKIEAEIKAHVTELEQMNKFMVGRELEMVKLKEKINQLLKNQGQREK
jgi:PAS domain S-box-containing protein